MGNTDTEILKTRKKFFSSQHEPLAGGDMSLSGTLGKVDHLKASNNIDFSAGAGRVSAGTYRPRLGADAAKERRNDHRKERRERSAGDQEGKLAS